MYLDVEHYLGVYCHRKKMQEQGIINPSEQIKKFTQDFIEKLKSLPLKQEIIFQDNSFYDDKGNLIMKMPDE